MRRIRDTLSSALNTAVKRGEGVLRNWATMIELPDPDRPRAEVWSPTLVATWRQTGVRPFPIMVWTPELTGRFLNSVVDDPHYALWHLLTFQGPRRGEAAGLRWDTGVNLQTRQIHIVQQYVRFGKAVVLGKPKADSARTMAMGEELHSLLAAEKNRQEGARSELHHLGVPWAGSGHVFVDEVGRPLSPKWIIRRFLRLIEDAGLPPDSPARPAPRLSNPRARGRNRDEGRFDRSGWATPRSRSLGHLHPRAATAFRGRGGDGGGSDPTRPQLTGIGVTAADAPAPAAPTAT